MSQDKPSQSHRLRLARNLQLLEDLWHKLVYVKWSRESFALLARLAQELDQTTRNCGDGELVALGSQLRCHINDSLIVKRFPRPGAQERLTMLLEALRHRLSFGGEGGGAASALQSEAAAVVLLIAAECPQQLLLKLADAGFQGRYFNSLDAAEAALSNPAPVAVIVDIDFPGKPLTGIEICTYLRDYHQLQAPVYVMAERDDMTARLEAVRAGSSGYFRKPVRIPELLGKLKNWFFQQLPQEKQRVLIVNEAPVAAHKLAQAVQTGGLIIHVVTQPLQVIQALYRFQPDLLLVDLDLNALKGEELVRVLSQHNFVETLPIILLTSCKAVQDCLPQREVSPAQVDLLQKPVAFDYLNWLLRQRLHRTRAMRAKLSALNFRDTVSGLYNRRYFLGQLERKVAALKISVSSVGIIFLALDNLRAIRDATDVLVADEVVAQAAGRLRKVLTLQYSIARFGDATFAVLMHDVPTEQLVTTAYTIKETLEGECYRVGNHDLLLHTSIGISTTTNAEQDFLTLLQQADVACSLARTANAERIHVYQDAEADRREGERQQKHLLEDIQNAVKEQRMRLVFQPIVSLHGTQQARYEVLLRMQSSIGQELLTETVFSATQAHSLGALLDRWVVTHAVRLLRDWQGVAPAPTLFIKLLPVTLHDRSLLAWLRELLQTVQVQTEQLVFQVTEATATQHLRELNGFLEAIKPLACGFCLDRFGRGTDSLRLLKHLDPDYVKLDMAFIQGLVGNQTKEQQLRTLAEQINSMQALTIVGHVEDIRILPLLWSCGINYVQGFFLQRPHEKMNYDFAGSAL